VAWQGGDKRNRDTERTHGRERESRRTHDRERERGQTREEERRREEEPRLAPHLSSHFSLSRRDKSFYDADTQDPKHRRWERERGERGGSACVLQLLQRVCVAAVAPLLLQPLERTLSTTRARTHTHSSSSGGRVACTVTQRPQHPSMCQCVRKKKRIFRTRTYR
jgi:hypothetical protein